MYDVRWTMDDVEIMAPTARVFRVDIGRGMVYVEDPISTRVEYGYQLAYVI